MSEWKEYKIKDITTEIGDGIHGTPNYSEDGEFYFINGNNIYNGKVIIKDDTKRVNRIEFEKYKKHLFDRTILLSINGTIGNVGFYNNEKCILGKSACYFNLKDNVDKHFIYYTFLADDFQSHLQNIATGTTIQNVPLKGLRESIILLPPLDEQKRIASILSSLDNKIDLLNRENTTLEAMAEALFRQWFIEEVKEDWEEGTIDMYANHYKESINPQKQPTTMFWHYSIPAFDNGKKPIDEMGEEIQSSKYIISSNCILFSKLNPHKDKRVWLILDNVSTNAICSTEFQIVKPKEKEYLYFLYGWLTNKENYEEIASGVGGTSGSHQRIDPKSIFTFACPYVNIDVIHEYNKVVEPLFLKQRENQKQIIILTEQRDRLLPKLMSNEINIK